MNWTTVLAIIGAVTGILGLSWQMWSYRLTGGRIQVLALRERREDQWWITTQILNIGRLDVSLVGYTVWVDVTGHRLQRLRERISMMRHVGLAYTRSVLFTFPPSIHVSAPATLEYQEEEIEFPFALKAGTMINIPGVGLGWQEGAKLRPRVAVHLGSGSIVRAWAIPIDAFNPHELKRRG